MVGQQKSFFSEAQGPVDGRNHNIKKIAYLFSSTFFNLKFSPPSTENCPTCVKFTQGGRDGKEEMDFCKEVSFMFEFELKMNKCRPMFISHVLQFDVKEDNLYSQTEEQRQILAVCRNILAGEL